MGQTARNVLVAFKEQTALGTPASGASAKVFRINSGQGLTLSKNKVRSNESRKDGQTVIGRHGSRSVSGSYAADATIGTYDDLIEDMCRSDWDTPLAITEADMTSITTTASTIVAAGGDWLTEGIRVGDVVYLENHSTAANNNVLLPVLGVTTSTITVPSGLLTLNASADTSFTLRRTKKVFPGTTPVKRYFTFEEQNLDTDASEVFTDCRTGSLQIQMQPDGMVTLTFGVMGRDMDVEEGATSPVFTSPTETSTIGLVAVDASILLNGTSIASLTGLDMTLTRNISVTPVVGDNVSPDVYDAPMTINGTISAIRDDMTLLQNFIDEDQLSLHLLLVDQDETAPRDFLSIYIPLLTLDGNSKQIGQDGPMVQTIPFEAGKLLSSTTTETTMVVFQTSAA